MASKAYKTFLPLFDRVLVKKLDPITKTASGILIPETAQAKVKQAIVLAHGPGIKHEAMFLKVGDKVMLPEFGGNNLKVEEEEVMLFRQNDFPGKFE